MRVRVDRGADAVHLELSDTAVARRVEAADGVAVAYDAAGRIVGVELRGVGADALHAFTVDLSGVADRPATAAPSRLATSPAAPPPPPPQRYDGPVTWHPDAEAAMMQVAFFQRGPTRLAAVALARKRGLAEVTTEIVAEARAGGR